MKRRQAVKSLASSAVALIALPTWANGWSASKLIFSSNLLSSNQKQTLEEITNTLIPDGEILGAKSLKIADFVEKMIQDCYEVNVKENFKYGLDSYEQESRKLFQKPFSQLEANQKLELLNKFQHSEDTKLKEAYALLKSLTIQGYSTSEYVMTKFLKYEMAPGHFYGCVDV